MTWAAASGYGALVEILLSHQVNVNAKDSWDNSALIKAARNGHSAVMEILLSHQVDVNAKDPRWNQTPLELAFTRGIPSIIEGLICSERIDQSQILRILHALEERNGQRV